MKIKSRRFLDTKTPSVHAASIEFWKGEPVFAWFGGSREGAEDVSTFIDNLNGNNCVNIGNMDRMPRWNPILFSHEGKLWLFEKAGIFCDRWQTFIYDIGDLKAETVISSPQVLPAGLNGPVKTRPIVEEGRILCGSSVETFYDWTSYVETYRVNDNGWDFVDRSDPISIKEKRRYSDFRGQIRNTLGVIQPAIWQDDSGTHSFFRSSSGLGKIYYAEETYTNTWEGPVETNLLNPNSGVDVVSIDNRVFLVSNPSSSSRAPLTIKEIIKKSDSEWETVNEIVVRDSINEEDKRFNGGSCLSEELSYPYMIEHDGELHLVYTYGRHKIEYCIISV
jgi:predicted neuraminidase